MEWPQYLLLFGSAALGGAVNSVAGGGTLLTFPALLWAGQPEIIANATSTVALWPGQLSSLWGYRQEVGRNRRVIALLAIPSFLGGLIGALLLLRTDNETFKALVPFLILLATLLFMSQETISRWLKSRASRAEYQVLEATTNEAGEREKAKGESPIPDTEIRHPTPDTRHPALDTRHPTPVSRWLGIMLFQLGVAIYGGYFGAGIGILMLAALGLLGFTNIHQMNGLKNINGLCINAVAAVLFIVKGLVDWRLAALMATGAIIGGYTGAGTARRIGQKNVRRLIIAIGFALTISLLLRR
jgi:uncharacterized protein